MATAQITHDETDRERHMLVARAESLRAQAAMLPEVLASTYRRRASELELEAWVLEVRSATSIDEIAIPA